MNADSILIGQLGLDKNNLIDMQRLAFLKGAKFWEYKTTNGTMWQSDQKDVWTEACLRYPASTEQQVQADPASSQDSLT